MHTTNPTDTFTSMLHAFDAKDWRAVRQAFADEVDVDYSSLSGVPAAKIAADELVAAWARAAGVFDVTQHVTGPFVVSPLADGVHARTHVRAYHRAKGAPDGEIWMVAGHYEIQLNPVGDAWKIAAITLHVLYQDGHVDIPADRSSRGETHVDRTAGAAAARPR